ncbi:CPBP family intramembrane glutamic endopeptidase [Pseudactinotalea sp. HY158]|uniref:CPBP family intramembrane glutamic endopeptidase n=1 Tax=Pseudactinotalea sp. HY158 TaxID=2654547 RepID=UPI00129C750B|nr:CPBP family intramembrane glutamic endopeptidase [Pseudactinotalea sp. HY158]QGH70762.1 CPBP family intramembrane metalloprotease [Pseudactinotalea sp. HY158]
MPAAHTSEGDRAPSPRPAPQRRRRLHWELAIVFGLSLGKSAVYAIVALIDAYTRGPIGDQTASLNTSENPRELFDLTYQLLSVAFALVPVVLALYLLSENGRRARRRIGLDGTRPLRDLGWGLALGAGIGIPGLGVYLAGRALGLTLHVSAAGIPPYWWTVPVLVLAALKNGLLEEILVVGYLRERLDELGWRAWSIVAASALLRGSYHLYQGWGPFVANVAMGVVFASFYLSRWGRRRVWPLVLAHTFIDVAAFVGYTYLPESWLHALGLV